MNSCHGFSKRCPLTGWLALLALMIPLGVMIGAGNCVAADAAAASPAAVAADLSGVWESTPGQRLKPVDAESPPFRADIAREYARRNSAAPPGLRRCVPSGVPALMYLAGPFQLLQTPSVMLFIHEANHLPRFVYFDRSAPADIDPTHLGFSTGRWDGSTLVIVTSGFQDKREGGWAGMPHSDALRVTERLSLADGGRTLVDEMTVEDPKAFTRTWRTVSKFTRQPGRRLQENVCALQLHTGGKP